MENQKINPVNPGAWYRNPEWFNTNDYVKGEYYSNGHIYFTEKIYGGKWEKKRQCWDGKYCVEVPLEVIQKYLPDGHPDKIYGNSSYYEIY